MANKPKGRDCPYCNTPMRPVALRCESCGIEINGNFKETLFHALQEEDIRLLEQYLLAGFSIKALAKNTGLGYTAIRNKLDRIIRHYSNLYNEEAKKKEILRRLASREISAAEATEMIKRLGPGEK